MLGAFFIAPGSFLESATLGGRRVRPRRRDRAVRDSRGLVLGTT
jgi:hypothetical protein